MKAEKRGNGSGEVQERSAGPRKKLERKAYDKELERLHGELVKLQEWVKHKGLKVCVVFEGRDGAGKGGTIKAIIERVSPRVFRVVALPAPTEREKSQMYVQRYLPYLPAAGEVVIFDRSWYNRAGVERVMGFCSEEMAEKFLQVRAGRRESDGGFRHHPHQVLAGSEHGRADPQARVAHRRRAQDLEALADGSQVLRPLVRLLAGARRDVRGDGHQVRAMARGAHRRQEARATEHHHSPARADSIQGGAAGESEAAEAAEARRLPRAGLPVQVHQGTILSRPPERLILASACGDDGVRRGLPPGADETATSAAATLLPAMARNTPQSGIDHAINRSTPCRPPRAEVRSGAGKRALE